MTFPPALEETASLWTARLRSGPLAPERARELADWLRQSPEHIAALQSFCDDSALIDASLLVLKSEGLAVETEPHATPRSPRRWFVAAGALAAAVALLVAFWPATTRTYRSAPGRPDTVMLDDGSRLELSANTALTVRLDRRTREVELVSGEALFTVAKDSQRPFFVRTSVGHVRVTGTIFDVRAPETNEGEVTVLEGRVEVSAPGTPDQPSVLHRGDQARLYGAAPVVRHLAAEEIERITAWRRGLVMFDAEPLRSALSRVATYHGRSIEVSPQLDGLTLGGSYDLTDMDGFLAAIEQVLPLHVLRSHDGRIRLVPR